MTRLIKHKWCRIIKLFIHHPIWHYGLPDILSAVQRDWDGEIGTSARSILKYMKENNTTECTIDFRQGGKPFLLLECKIRVPVEPVL
jgi:hypothetical protein